MNLVCQCNRWFSLIRYWLHRCWLCILGSLWNVAYWYVFLCVLLCWEFFNRPRRKWWQIVFCSRALFFMSLRYPSFLFIFLFGNGFKFLGKLDHHLFVLSIQCFFYLLDVVLLLQSLQAVSIFLLQPFIYFMLNNFIRLSDSLLRKGILFHKSFLDESHFCLCFFFIDIKLIEFLRRLLRWLIALY